MGVIQITLPEEVQSVIERQVAAGRAPSRDAFLEEAARRYAQDLDAEDEIVAEALAGIADAEAGRYVTISTPEEADLLHQRAMERVRNRLATQTP